jgi:2-hydroxychromene-2-carboxylate isomerase
MGIRKKLEGMAIQAYLSAPVRRARTHLHEVKRRVAGAERVVELYYQVDDPQSHLLAQLLPRLVERYGVSFEVIVVPPPSADADPEPKLRQAYAARDAAELARYYDLSFPTKPARLDPGRVLRANSIMVNARGPAEMLEAALAVGDALWRGDGEAMAQARGRFGSEATGAVPPTLHSNYARLRKHGHYQGGTVRYGGEWYAGTDRLCHLEDRLRSERGEPAGGDYLVAPRPEAEIPAERLPEEDGLVPLDFYFSFRSPYSYLAIDRTLALAERYPVALRLRPVLPMVSRGLALPAAKRMYLVTDAKREAERLGVPFGRICDPLGRGVEICLALFAHAERARSGAAFVQSAMRGIWSEALDMTDYVDLRRVVERAELDWAEAKEALADEGWKALAEENRAALTLAGLWGVPSFQIGEQSIWGQDRLPLLEAKLRAHVAAPAAEASG